MRKPTRVGRSETRSSERPYCPNVGDFIWLDFNPQKGREQAGRRPALVLTPRRYNELAELCILCPVTSRAKGYPFEVPISGDSEIKGGVVLADHVKSLSWRERNAAFAGTASPAVLAELRAKLKALLGTS